MFLSFLLFNTFQWIEIQIYFTFLNFEHNLYLTQKTSKIFFILYQHFSLNLNQILIMLSIFNFLHNCFDKLNVVFNLLNKVYLRM
jgi:hypothetical protein